MNMRSFDEFLDRLELFDWSPAGSIESGVLDLLRDLGHEPELIHQVVASWIARNFEERQLRCHDTATHYKWFIYYHSELHYRIWLHQYKSPEERRDGYATVPHNHRYSLASLIVRGGFDHHLFERREGKLVELAQERQTYARHDAYMLEWHNIHKLSTLHEDTITLVVESPVVRHFSEAFYSETEGPRLVYDFTELHSRLSQEMAYP
jgi:hypothetical protein